jgi:hypothetical protein
MAFAASSRAPSARIVAPLIREPNISCRDSCAITAAFAGPAIPLQFEDRSVRRAYRFDEVCNLYLITTNQAAIAALFRVINGTFGNLPPGPARS